MLILKSIVYRVLRIIISFIVSYLVVGDLSTAAAISAVDAVVATVYYYYFDKLWDKFLPRTKHLMNTVKYRRMNKR